MVVAGVSTIILASVILFAIIAIIASTANKRRMNRAGKTLPGPPRWPLIGNTFYFKQKMEDLVDVFTSLFDSYPAICQMWIGPKMIVLINDPDFSKTVLVDHKLTHRSYVEMLFKDALGTGLITAQSSIWRLHRKIIGPSFNSSVLRNFIDVFDTQSKIMVERLGVHQDGPELDMVDYISRCIFDMINETAMNVKLGTQANQDQEFKTAMDSMNEIGTMRFFKPWLHPEFFFNLSSLGARYAKYVKAARGFAKRVMKKQMEKISNQRLCPEVVDQGEQAETPSIQRITLLNTLMDWTNGEVKLQDEEIVDQLITILIAAVILFQNWILLNKNGETVVCFQATDTTVTATNMLMLALASYPDVQKKVYEEVTQVCGVDDEQTITVHQLNNLVYLERVIKEILRLFPVLGILPRDVMEDISIGDYHIPKGAVVIVATFLLHKNEQFWPDPLKFDPDRFLPEEVGKRHPYAYMPFGAGPRNCIGGKFGILTMKMICAKVVQKYALEKDHPKNIADTKMKFGITIKACDPVTVRIRKRNANIAKA